MKNKIFNAIQKGLTNALVFDDTDSSISYRKTNINNELTIPKVSLEELYDIFKNEKNDIFSYDTKGCVSLILDNNQEISLHEYMPDDKPVFLKISNSILKKTGNEIIIACDNDHYIPNNEFEWQKKNNQILPNDCLTTVAADDFNGYEKCQIILNAVNKSIIPAINYCNNIKSPLPNYKGYLPAVGQMGFIIKYLEMINYIFEYINVEYLKLDFESWWTSSEYSYNFVCNMYDGKVNLNNKEYSNKILPLFHLEK